LSVPALDALSTFLSVVGNGPFIAALLFAIGLAS
jgi:hypothetical protein